MTCSVFVLKEITQAQRVVFIVCTQKHELIGFWKVTTSDSVVIIAGVNHAWKTTCIQRDH